MVSNALRMLVVSTVSAASAALPGLEASSADALAVGVTHKIIVRASATRTRQLASTIWYPAVGDAMRPPKAIADLPVAKGRYPVVVYSHGGCGGSPTAIEPIAVPLAGAGFVFVQFPHPGSTADDCVSGGPRYTESLLERPDDIAYVLEELRRLNDSADWVLRGALEIERVGIIGHSQGGQTALMMPARDQRVKAAFAISPSVAHPDSPPDLWEAIRVVRVPVMIVHGDHDANWTSEGPLKAFDSLPGETPRAYLEINGMGHTPGTPVEVGLILRYATAWFRLYLTGDESARAVLDPAAAPPNVTYRQARMR
jgi:predicted dienelactone hydrolase